MNLPNRRKFLSLLGLSAAPALVVATPPSEKVSYGDIVSGGLHYKPMTIGTWLEKPRQMKSWKEKDCLVGLANTIVPVCSHDPDGQAWYGEILVEVTEVRQYARRSDGWRDYWVGEDCCDRKECICQKVPSNKIVLAVARQEGRSTFPTDEEFQISQSKYQCSDCGKPNSHFVHYGQVVPMGWYCHSCWCEKDLVYFPDGIRIGHYKDVYPSMQKAREAGCFENTWVEFHNK